MYTVKELFSMEHTQAQAYLFGFLYPWEALTGLAAFLTELGKSLPKEEYIEIQPQVWVHKSCKIAPSASFISPCIVGANTEVRQGALLRGGVLIGENCVIGNSTEIKNSILFDGVQAPHYNYIGDSILGFKAHLGAGSVISNLKSDKKEVVVRDGLQTKKSHLRKLGAMVGDFVEVGCNSVLNPGCVLGRGVRVYPLSCVRGTVRENCIYKTGGVVVEKREEGNGR